MPERIPGFKLCIRFCHQRTDLFLLEQRVEFHLIDSRLCREVRNKLLPDRRRHIADADGSQRPFRLCLLHSFPGAGHVAIGLVNEIQINIAQIQLPKGSGNPFLCSLITVILQPQLAGNEDLIARDSAVTDRSADVFFVKISRCRINMAVACF